MKVLVIEDHATELKLVHHVLTCAGHEVNGAAAAENAFDEIKRERPQVILLDMSLPGLDGLALVRMLKAEPTTHDIPVVGATSFPEKYTRAKAIAAGCDAYFVKPLSTRELPKQLDAVVLSRIERTRT